MDLTWIHRFVNQVLIRSCFLLHWSADEKKIQYIQHWGLCQVVIIQCFSMFFSEHIWIRKHKNTEHEFHWASSYTFWDSVSLDCQHKQIWKKHFLLTFRYTWCVFILMRVSVWQMKVSEIAIFTFCGQEKKLNAAYDVQNGRRWTITLDTYEETQFANKVESLQRQNLDFSAEAWILREIGLLRSSAAAGLKRSLVPKTNSKVIFL